MIEIFKTLSDCITTNKSVVMVTITEVKGASPGKVGFKMLVGEEGRIAGTIGGGGAEFYCVNKCKELLTATQKNLVESILLSNKKDGNGEVVVKNDKSVIQMDALCGGEITIFYEVYKPLKQLNIFGAGHVGQALGKLAKIVGFAVNYYDNRHEIIESLTNDMYTTKAVADFPLLNTNELSFELTDDSYNVIVTHQHHHDMTVLRYLMRNHSNLRYIGMIGSTKKVRECISKLIAEFDGKIDLSNLYSPIGLDLGGDTPIEIAIAILAEIQAADNKIASANHLRLDFSKLG